MSRPRYDWWPYVKGMIRRYPELKAQYADLHSAAMVADYSGMPRGGGGNSRTSETVALRELPSTRQREFEAVRRAVEATERFPNGEDRLKVIRLVLWDRSHTLEGAALKVHCSYMTVRRYHCEFICMVAKFYGLIDE